MRFGVVCACLGLMGMSLVGCSGSNSASSATEKNQGPAVPSEGATTYTGPFAAGRKVFDDNRCSRCHSLADDAPSQAGRPDSVGNRSGPPGRSGPISGSVRGPALATVGAKRTKDWLIEHIKNPKTHNPQSRMPAFESRITVDDLQALADYLASLK